MRFDRRTYFITVAETRNISKAAQILRVSQPSLSQYISRLEEHVGWKLLNRNSNPITLTEAGEIYLDYIKEVTEAAKRTAEKLDNLRSEYSDSITVGIPSQLFAALFKDYVADFIKKHDSVNVIIEEGTSLTLRDMLICGDVDIAIFHTTAESNQSFTQYNLYDEELYLSCNAGQAFLKGKKSTREKPLKITPEISEELSKLRFVQPPGEYLITAVIDELCKSVNIRQRKIQRLPDTPTIAKYIASPGSDGVSVLPVYLCAEFDEWDKIAFLKPERGEVKWSLTMGHRADKPFTKTEELFWNMAIETSSRSRE